MAKCGSCNKFCGYEDPPTVEFDQTPEITDGELTATMRVVLLSECCATEVKEAYVEVSEEVPIPDEHLGVGHELSVEAQEPEGASKTEGRKGAPARYRKTYYGGEFNYKVTCSCGFEVEGNAEGYEQASFMEEVA